MHVHPTPTFKIPSIRSTVSDKEARLTALCAHVHGHVRAALMALLLGNVVTVIGDHVVYHHLHLYHPGTCSSVPYSAKTLKFLPNSDRPSFNS